MIARCWSIPQRTGSFRLSIKRRFNGPTSVRPLRFVTEEPMPALFAYLIALGLLFGTGYGALNWLAQPEPVKVAAKAKPKSKSPPYQAPSQEVAEATPPASKSDDSSPASKPSVNDHDGASLSIDRQTPPQAQPSAAAAQPSAAAADKQATPPEAAAPAPAIRSANAEISSEEAKRSSDETRRSADESKRNAELSIKPAVRADQPRTSQTRTSQTDVSSAPEANDRISKRSHPRQAGSHGERRALAVMTLRTIEFPDGRRITQLIPLGGGEPLSAR
jgi:hypothetical protein